MRSPRSCAVLPLLLLALLSLPLPFPGRAVAADAPPMAWEVSFDSFPELGGSGYDVFDDVLPTADGGVVAAGYAMPPGLSWTVSKGFVIRLDANGTEIWRTYLGDDPEGDDVRVHRVRPTADGGFLAACSSWVNRGSWSGGGIYYSVSFLSRLDAGGAELWRYRFDPLVVDLLQDIDLLPDGSAVGAGRAWIPAGNVTGVGVTSVAVKVSAAGNLLWARPGGPADHVPYRVAAAPDGGFYAASAEGYRHSVDRYGADGAFLWSAPLSGVDGDGVLYEKRVDGLTALPDGGCAVAGAAREQSLSPAYYGPYRPFLLGFDGSGRQLSTLVVDTPSEWNHAVERLPDGGLVSVEGPGSDTAPRFVRYDRTGAPLWSASYGDAYSISAIRRTGAGGFAAAGTRFGGERWSPLDGYALLLDPEEGVEPPPPPPPAVAPRIDVLPGSPDNPVNPRSKGLLPVALLSSDSFDACRVDAATVTLEGAPVAKAGRKLHAVRKDADGDGRCDLLLHFSVPALKLAAATTEVTLRGTLPGGGAFSASDAVRIVGVPARKAVPVSRKGTGTVRATKVR